MTVGFRRRIEGICALLEYYSAQNGRPLQTFRENVCPETLVRDYHYTLRRMPKERRSSRVRSIEKASGQEAKVAYFKAV